MNDQNKSWRLFYKIDDEAIVILGVAEKKTQQSPAAIINAWKKEERAMKKPNAKNSKVESGWVEGSVQDFLDLSDADMLIIETRLAASRLLKATRQKSKLTQQKMAERLRTSQSRLAKMEAGDSSVSLDHLLRSLFALGVSRKSVANIFSGASRHSV